jgi:hypothetical protein
MKTIFNTILFTLLSLNIFAQKAGSLMLSISQQEPTCSRYSDGSITVTPSGGVAPYQYIWSTGETTMTIDSLLAGNYSVSVIDANGQITAAFITLVDPLPIIVVGTSQNTQLNQSNGLIDITDVLNTQGSWSYMWASNNGFSCNQTTLDQSGLPVGNYKIIVTDEMGCQGIGYYSINAYFTPFVNPSFKTKPSLNSTSAISTYPNPSDGNFTIEAKDEVSEIRIVNVMTGHEVLKSNDHWDKIVFDGLGAGDYIIWTTVKNEVQQERISVIR